MDLSFIILTWNSEPYLQRCLTSIADAMEASGLLYEVLVLDNGSRDRTRALLEEIARRDTVHIRPYYEPSNLGTTRSRNILLGVAQGKFVCVMDSDVEISAGAIERLLPHLRAPSAGIVVPRILYPSGRWQKSFDRFPTVVDKVNRFLRLRAMERAEADSIGEDTSPFDIDYAISAFWLMPRSLFTTIGYLDERIFYAPEDVDFCLRVWRAGLRVTYEPAVTVIHHTQEISRGFKLNRAKLSHIKGLIYYFMKHRYFMRRPQFAVGDMSRRHRASTDRAY